MKLTKEELDKWEASGDVKRMSHANIVKGIVNIKKVEETMSRSEYKNFRVLYEMELLIDDVYEITCAGFWAIVTDIVIRLKTAAPMKHFIFNECILQRVKKIIKPSEFSWWFLFWMVFVGALVRTLIGFGGWPGALLIGLVVALVKTIFKKRDDKIETVWDKLKIYALSTLLYVVIAFIISLCFTIMIS